MGNSECEIDTGECDRPEEEPHLDLEEGGDTDTDTDTPSPSPVDVDHQISTQRSPNGNANSSSLYSAKDNKTPPTNTNAIDGNGNGNAEPVTPRSLLKPHFTRTAHDALATRSTNGVKKLKVIEEDEEAGTKEEQVEFMKELDTYYKGRHMDFKPPKFYGEPLNLLKLWRAVIQLGGYDRVTTSKLWRQVGESFHPPKTCTTVSWTFRIFYEKALLEYEKHKREIGELEFPEAPIPESTSIENEGSAYQNTSGRVLRDAAARAMQGWHAQRLCGFGEVGEPIIKDKSLSSAQKREKHLKNIGVKQKKSSNLEPVENEMHAETNKQLTTTVVDVGPPADWVKINVRESKDCFEVYALVPGLLREEVRVQSDPAGRLVITGQPEQLDNPWGITPFKKVVSLPARIDPLHTSAVVSLHGRLFVRVPFDRSNT